MKVTAHANSFRFECGRACFDFNRIASGALRVACSGVGSVEVIEELTSNLRTEMGGVESPDANQVRRSACRELFINLSGFTRVESAFAQALLAWLQLYRTRLDSLHILLTPGDEHLGVDVVDPLVDGFLTVHCLNLSFEAAQRSCIAARMPRPVIARRQLGLAPSFYA